MIKKKSLKQWLSTLETQHNKKIDLGLKRVSQVYNNLNLNKIAPIIITVAGTNGKGSTVAILSSICQQAGYKVGEFTSPHIIKYNERIKINSQLVNDDEIVDSFEQIEKKLDGITLSYFEYSTLAAAIVFKQEKVDIAILEVGLGGRLDSVNIIDADCAVITTIDIDHTHFLGEDIESIAFEKAGIMRKNKPAIYGDTPCPKSIIKHAESIGAELIQACNNNYPLPEINLLGDFQQKNALTAITAIQSLKNQINISLQNINKGLASVKLTGRLQTISKNPQVIIDVSHNKQAVIELSKWLTNNPIEGETIAVFAVLEDKKPLGWLNCFKNNIDYWCISQVDASRAMPRSKLLLALTQSASLITSHQSVSQAFKNAKIMAEKNDRIIVFGSFYTVSEVMSSCE